MEYTVVLTQQSGMLWRAAALNLPDCVVEAPTRTEALKNIQERIVTIARQSEVLRLQIPVIPKIVGRRSEVNELEFKSETPWQWFGAFRDDPTWTTLFDEIEQQRDAHLVGEQE